MWVHRTAILARIFDSTPEIFDDRVSTLAFLGAMVQVRLTKAGLRELTSNLREKTFRCHVAYCFLMRPPPH